MGNTQPNMMATKKSTITIKDGIVGVIVNANGTPIGFLSPDKSDIKKTTITMLDGSAPPADSDPTIKRMVLTGNKKVQTMSIKQTPLESSITLFATGASPVIIPWKVLPELLPGSATAPTITTADTSAPAATVPLTNPTYGVPIASIETTCKTSEYLQDVTLSFDMFTVADKMIAIKFTSADSKKCSPLSTFSIWYILLIVIVCIALAIMVVLIYKNKLINPVGRLSGTNF